MINDIFGEMIFSTGWKTSIRIELFNKIENITVKAKAYYEKDGITREQEVAFSDFKKNISDIQATVEKMLRVYSEENKNNVYTPQTLLIERDGSYAILFDDSKDLDNGIAICLEPEVKILTQDEYL